MEVSNLLELEKISSDELLKELNGDYLDEY